MKTLHISLIAVIILLISPAFALAGGYETASKTAPPVGQQVIREGDYAIELATALKLGTDMGEADAENALASVEIAPKSGWISDFPVTPDIIADLQVSIDVAADAGRLPMNKIDADNAFVALNTDVGLAITSAAATDTEEAPPAEPTIIENYYYSQGPPIITYYAPPPDYAYLYTWDPFPFWCSGFWFPGFFVLADFDFVFASHGHFAFIDRDDFHFYRHHQHWDGHRQISNHVIDPVSRRAVAIDPVSKRPLTRTAFRPVGGKSFDPISRTTSGRGQRFIGNAGVREGRTQFGRTFDRTSAANIVNRSTGRVGRAEFGRSSAPSPSFRRDSMSRESVPGSINRPSDSFSRPRMDSTLSRPIERGSGISRSRSFTTPGRSFSAPSRPSIGSNAMRGGRGITGGGSVGRSFSSGGSGRSFSGGGGGGRSFSGGGGGGGRGFSGGGGGGHGFGGRSGR